MNFLFESGNYLLQFIFGSFAALALLRAWCVAWNIPMGNSIGQFVMAITDWIVLPLRKIFPRSRFDWASLTVSLLCAVLFNLFFGALIMLIGGSIFSNLIYLPITTVFTWMRWAIYLVIVFSIVSAVFSWVNPHHHSAHTINQINAPLLAPIRKVIPPIGQFDLSALVLIVLCNLLLIALKHLHARMFMLF